MYFSLKLQKYDVLEYENLNMTQQVKFRHILIRTTLHPGVSFSWYTCIKVDFCSHYITMCINLIFYTLINPYMKKTIHTIIIAHFR